MTIGIILQIANEKEYIRGTMNYIFQRTSAEQKKEIVNFIIKEISSPLGGEIMTWEESCRYEGRTEGKIDTQKTIAANMLREGISFLLQFKFC